MNTVKNYPALALAFVAACIAGFLADPNIHLSPSLRVVLVAASVVLGGGATHSLVTPTNAPLPDLPQIEPEK